MVSTLILSLTLLKPLQPHENAGCSGAPLYIGTSNVPVMNNDAETSVVNIWPLVSVWDTSLPPVAWLYKNAASMYFVQLNGRADLSKFKGIPLGAQLLKAPQSGGNYPIAPLTLSDLVILENALSAKGIVRASCFTSDFHAKK